MNRFQAMLLCCSLACDDDKPDTASWLNDTEVAGAPQADLLFVIDNSVSMYDAASALALNFECFTGHLASGPADLRLGITTTSAEDVDGTVDPGEAGTLLGDELLISSDDEAYGDTFLANLLCSATCWPAECQGNDTSNCVPYDEDYVCGEVPEGVSWDYLACICGEDWV